MPSWKQNNIFQEDKINFIPVNFISYKFCSSGLSTVSEKAVALDSYVLTERLTDIS